MAEQLMTLCEDCAEKLREKYVLNPVCWVPGCCSRAECGNSPAMQYEYMSKAEIRQRQHYQSQRSRDTRAYYREPWRES